jgi:hypothetical protein
MLTREEFFEIKAKKSVGVEAKNSEGEYDAPDWEMHQDTKSMRAAEAVTELAKIIATHDWQILRALEMLARNDLTPTMRTRIEDTLAKIEQDRDDVKRRIRLVENEGKKEKGFDLPW